MAKKTVKFKTIGLFAKPNSKDSIETLKLLLKYLKANKFNTILEENCAKQLDEKLVENTATEMKIGHQCDLIIVIGGDGSMLKAARCIVDDNVPMVGINRGKLGFLSDIPPSQMESCLDKILAGVYETEDRILLEASVIRGGATICNKKALNDIVFYNGDVARVIEFELFINDQFVMSQRSDGLIAATPTGSTAYALSGGGPILYPSLGAISLVPMYPHTLSGRPIVIHDDSTIRLIATPNKQHTPKICCDGQTHVALAHGDEVHIKKYCKTISLIHPKGYNYFALLREKLGWNTHKGKP